MKATYFAFLGSVLLLATAPAAAEDVSRVFLIGAEAFVENDIIDARAQPGIDGIVSVLVTLEPAASVRFGVITRAYIGKTLPISLNGKTLTEPVVQEAIMGGAFEISGRLTLQEAERLALQISGKPPLRDSLED
jgi:preprotein translocase subunit SecD